MSKAKSRGSFRMSDDDYDYFRSIQSKSGMSIPKFIISMCELEQQNAKLVEALESILSAVSQDAIDYCGAAEIVHQCVIPTAKQTLAEVKGE